MKRDVGAWNVVIKMFGDPSGEPAVGKGTETNVMLGDLWLIGRFKGDIMGASFEGLRQTGFDPEKKKFVASWVDSKTPYPTHIGRGLERKDANDDLDRNWQKSVRQRNENQDGRHLQ